MIKEQGFSKSIYYFSTQGKDNLGKTVELATKRALALHLRHIVVFTGAGEGAILLHEALHQKHRRSLPQVVAVTFPYKTVFVTRDPNGTAVEFTPPTSDEKVRHVLGEVGIPLIRGAMPLWEIVLPGMADGKIRAIEASLSLFSGGMSLCVQAILMACDAGYVEPEEEIVSMSADTAIVASAAQTRWLFHPTKGLQIREIICMPRRVTTLEKPEQVGNAINSSEKKKEGKRPLP